MNRFEQLETEVRNELDLNSLKQELANKRSDLSQLRDDKAYHEEQVEELEYSIDHTIMEINRIKEELGR